MGDQRKIKELRKKLVLAFNQVVVGSIPARLTNKNKELSLMA
jgi:hypothetical protein